MTDSARQHCPVRIAGSKPKCCFIAGTNPTSCSAPPIPGLHIPHLPAGESSHAMLHFFSPSFETGENRSKMMDEVYVQQLAKKGHGTDSFGLRLSVNGQMQAISAVTLYTARVEPSRDGDYEWYDYRNIVGNSGVDAYKILFNSDVLLPGIDVRTQVIEAVVPADGVLDKRSHKRSYCTTSEYVSQRTGFGLDNITGRKIFTFCTMVLFPTGEVIAAGGFNLKVWQYELFNFRFDVADWPVLDERVADTPAGKHSHLSLSIDHRDVWMRLAEDDPHHVAFPFGFILSIDNVPRTVAGVRMYEVMDEESIKIPHRSRYIVGTNGMQAFTLMFNTELLRAGDEARTLAALLGSVDALDVDSARRKEWVLGEMQYVKQRTRFGGRNSLHSPNNIPFFTFCTCSAYDNGEGWRFRVFEFEVEFSDS